MSKVFCLSPFCKCPTGKCAAAERNRAEMFTDDVDPASRLPITRVCPFLAGPGVLTEYTIKQ